MMAEYKIKVLELHPDKNPSKAKAAEYFAILQEAKDVLTDPELKDLYDLWRKSEVLVSFQQWKSMRNVCRGSTHWISNARTDPMLKSSTHTNNLYKSKTGLDHQNKSHSFVLDETSRKFANYEI